MSRELANLKKKIGERIRSRRSELHISQEDLAFRAEVTPTYLSQVEAGKRNPSLGVLFSISTALQVELPELLKP